MQINFFQNELIREIYSKGLVRSIAKVLLMNSIYQEHQSKPIMMVKHGLVCKQTAVFGGPHQ